VPGCQTSEARDIQAPSPSGRFFELLIERFSSDPYDATERQRGSSLRELFHRLTLDPERARALIELRGRLLGGLGANPSWAAIDAELMRVIRAWFDSDVLEFRRIDGRAAGEVLENLIKYEAVHQIRDDRDLERRLAADRRCFGFFHPALPDEPLIFTELALTSGLSAKVQLLLDPDSTVLDPRSCDCAVFYSISSCHEGLRGVRLGNNLIKRVVDRLHREFRQLKTVATLSPIPGFRSWLMNAARDGNRRFAAMIARMEESNWMRDAARSAELEQELIPLCETYLLRIKRGTEPADPVARFHLGNGARLERLNWLGDTSPAGMDRSAGITANYRYRLSDL
jgi:malonyl-CoA decarboxylase